MVGTEGADWKRHRAVAKPAFNEVCGERTEIYKTQISAIDYSRRL